MKQVGINIQLKLDEYKNNNYLTHGFHPYPAKFIPQIPKEVIKSLSSSGDWVLDPFCGSGTTLVEADLLGRNAIGIDVNPLACLMATAKVTHLDPEQQDLARSVILETQTKYSNGHTADIPHFDGINHWFKPEVQTDLALIKSTIDEIADLKVKTILQTAFSAIVVRVSNQENDTRYKAISKNYTKGDAIRFFASKAEEMFLRSGEFKENSFGGDIRVINEDANHAILPVENIKLVVTSPPYMNSYDYYLYHKHRMNWLGLNYRTAQEKEIGSRNKHNDKGLGLEVYRESIFAVFKNINTYLSPNAYVAIIIGDSILRGQLIRMNECYDDIMNSLGYYKVQELVFPQRKYTRSFTPNLRTQDKNSYLLVYTNTPKN